MREVDDVALVAAHERRRVEPRLHFAQRIAGYVAPFVHGVDDRCALLALNEQDVLHVQHAHAVAVLEQQPARLRARLHGLGALRRVAARLDNALRALKRGKRPLRLEGLEQIVERVHLKGVGHVAVVRGGKNENGLRVGILQDAGALHARHAGHFHVEQHDLRAVFRGQLQQRFAVGSLAAQVEAAAFFKQLPHQKTHPCVVVGNQRAYGFHAFLLARGRFPRISE